MAKATFEKAKKDIPPTTQQEANNTDWDAPNDLGTRSQCSCDARMALNLLTPLSLHINATQIHPLPQGQWHVQPSTKSQASFLACCLVVG